MEEMKPLDHKKGRGAKLNTKNPFFREAYEICPEYQEYCRLEQDEEHSNTTEYIEVFPKSIVTKVDSPDIGFNWSINPYQGCEHGCIYCYARNSHEYWGYSAGTEFEQKILVKKNAPELLRKKLNSRNWVPETIVLSGNTDCYQPAERKFRITRQLLEIFNDCRHPVGLITKNALILRDIDLLKELNKDGLTRVTISITSLNEELRRKLEPRTSSVRNRLKTVEELSKAGIPVNVNFAPIIPGLNSHELFDLAREVAERGAVSASYIMVRLNGRIAELFKDWVRSEYPDRSEKVLNQIKSTHGGSLNESRWKLRMKGEGNYAEQIARMFRLACEKYELNKTKYPPLNTLAYKKPGNGQFSMF